MHHSSWIISADLTLLRSTRCMILKQLSLLTSRWTHSHLHSIQRTNVQTLHRSPKKLSRSLYPTCSRTMRSIKRKLNITSDSLFQFIFLKTEIVPLEIHSRLCNYLEGRDPELNTQSAEAPSIFSCNLSIRTCNDILIRLTLLLCDLSCNLTAGIVSPYV